MKRAETFWQIVVLGLVLLMTIGIYTTLGLLIQRVRQGGPTADHNPASRDQGVVQIVEPLDGAILQQAAALPVHAVLNESGFLRAELLGDGLVVAAQVNPDPDLVPWTVSWTWEGASEGRHRVEVQARGADGQIETSVPQTVTVVPAGRLYFASNRDGAYAIHVMQTDGRGLERLTAGPGDARQPAARDDGALAFVVKAGASQAMIRQMGGGGTGAEDLIAGRDPAWSPDGASLAFAADPEGVSQVFLASTVGAALAKFTHEEVYAGQPAWSPDGTRLAYVVRREGDWDIWLSYLDGSGTRPLTDDPGRDLSPAWSPDGSQIAFVSSRGGSYQVYVMAADGSDVRPLTAFAQGAESPAWSPDGFWLAFVAYTGEGTGVNAREIYLMRADGQNQVRLTHNAFDDTDPAWVRR